MGGASAFLAALAATAIYALLMLLLWLHERFPPVYSDQKHLEKLEGLAGYTGLAGYL